MHFKIIFIMLFPLLGLSLARFNVIPKFYAQDSAVIVDTDQPLPSLIKKPPPAMLPYYQPVQSLPSYKIVTHSKQQNSNSIPSLTATNAPAAAAIFTKEEFPRDLLEIAQQKLGLKTLDEVPSISELAELLGTNSAVETIDYIRQLTSTDQGIALMKAYIESGDYTDSIGNRENDIAVTDGNTTPPPVLSTQTTPVLDEQERKVAAGFLERIAAFLNIYNIQPKHKQALESQLLQQSQTTYKNLRSAYFRSPLPYHYPIPLRPVPMNRRVNSTMRTAKRPTETVRPLVHLNTIKSLTPAHIQQLARVSKVPAKKLESFLQTKPKLAELAVKVARFPLAHERSTLADGQLLAAIQKAMEQDEDLRKLLASTETLK